MYSLSFKWENYRDYVLARNFWDTRRLVHQNDDLGNSQNHIPSQRLFICWRNQPTSVLLVGQCCVLNVPSMPFCQAQSWPQSCFNISTYQTKTKHMQNWRVSQCQRDTHTHNLNKLERSQWNLPITSHLSFFDDDKITSERNHLNGLAIVQAESGDRSIFDQQQQQEQQTTSWTKCWDHTNKSSHQ